MYLDVVHGLKDTIECYHSLFKGAKDALCEARKAMAGEFKLAPPAIFKKLERVLGGV